VAQIKAVIFDMYQTLVQDPSGQWRHSFKTIIEEQGLDIIAEQLWQGWHESEVQFRLRRTDPALPFQTYYDAWAGGFRLAFETLEVPGDADAATKRFFADLSRRQPFPETGQALEEIQHDYRIAVLSNADDGFLLPNLELLDVEFETVLSSEMARSYKPQPELFRTMLDRLSLEPGETVYVGDRHYEDVHGASSVGMNAVWIDRNDRGLREDLPPPAHRVTSLLELSALIETSFHRG
jgi:2-haloalkanoic acid dehalogenase type II